MFQVNIGPLPWIPMFIKTLLTFLNPFFLKANEIPGNDILHHKNECPYAYINAWELFADYF